MIYFSSDLHFSHFNIITHCKRPFKTIQEMNETLVSNFNSIVKPDDTLYHLGDLSMGYRYEPVAYLVSRLNGRKIFIRGNHDNKKHLNRLKEDGLIENWHDTLDIMIDNQHILLTHTPYNDWQSLPEGTWCLQGHLHLKTNEGVRPFCLDVGVDANNYFPISFEQLKELFDKQKLELM